MSLRNEIRAALDDVTPPAPALEKKVTAYVRAGVGDRVVRVHRPRIRWTRQFRGPMSLVAAALLVLLIGGLVLGGRLLRDLNAPPSGINPAEVRKLESKPLQVFPTVRPGDPCPTSPLTDVSAHGPESLLFGEGPAYSTQVGYRFVTTEWGTWVTWSVLVDTTKASGLVLVRATDLQTHEMVVFARHPFGQTDAAGSGIPTGSALGSQVVQGVTLQLYPELVVDLSRPYLGTRPGDWPIYKIFMGYPKAATGCIGFQIDGSNFTELLVVK